MQMAFEQILDAAETLPLEQRMDLAELLRQRAVMDRRNEMIAQAKETSAAYRQGKLEATSVTDFMNQL
jgi:hypothetical protein